MQERKKIKPYRNGRTLEEYQNRCGIEEGYKRWKKRNDRQSYRFSKQYYLDTYGEVEGNIKWCEYKKSMDKTSLNSFISRYGKKIGSDKYNEYIETLRCNDTYSYYSTVSQKLFWDIYEMLDDKNDIKFAELNGEEFFYPNEEWRRVFPVDFKLGKKIIEFDGDYWHSSEEVIMIDNKKDEFLTKAGYEVFRVKESDYYKDKKRVLNECIKFLKK